MKQHRKYLVALVGFLLAAFVLVFPMQKAAQIPPTTQLISQSSILTGLAAGAVFPFIDTTPNRIVRAHIALTDATTHCGGPSRTAPANVQVLVGEAGVALVPVMSSAANTGIGSSTQCVFHLTVEPGVGGVPATVTDVVVVNTSASALSGINTVTVSAEVR
jgi:hypothetical protein